VSKLDHFPNFWGKKKYHLKPTPSPGHGKITGWKTPPSFSTVGTCQVTARALGADKNPGDSCDVPRYSNFQYTVVTPN